MNDAERISRLRASVRHEAAMLRQRHDERRIVSLEWQEAREGFAAAYMDLLATSNRILGTLRESRAK